MLDDAAHVERLGFPVDLARHEMVECQPTFLDLPYRLGGIVLGIDRKQHAALLERQQRRLAIIMVLDTQPLANHAVPQCIVEIADHHFPLEQPAHDHDDVAIHGHQHRAEGGRMLAVGAEKVAPRRAQPTRSDNSRLVEDMNDTPLRVSLSGAIAQRPAKIACSPL